MSTGQMVVREQQALEAGVTNALTNAQLKFISNTDFVPKSMRGNMPAILACVATGRALGLADMTSLRSINIIDGKASFSAELMVNLVRQAGHSITFKASGDSCTVYGKRDDNGDEGEFTWTMDMAKRAGLLGKDNWKKYPEAMLWARAVSQLARMLFADCFAGASYTPEELGYGDVTADELMDEPAGEADAPESTADDPAGSPAEILSVTDEEIHDGAAEAVTQDQRDRLLTLCRELSDAKPKLNVGQMLTNKIRTDYAAGSYRDLNGKQMDEILSYLAGEVVAAKPDGEKS